MINIGIIEEQVFKQQELKNYINSQDELVCCFVAASVDQFIKKISPNHTILVILYFAAKCTKLPLDVAALKRHLPDSDVVVLANEEETNLVLDSLRAGALGYLHKNTSFPDLKKVIMGVSLGGAYMSPFIARKVADYFQNPAQQESYELTCREKEIVTCLTQGLSYKLIAAQLVLSLDTVRFHLRNIYKKLQVNSKSEVIAKVLKKEITLV